MGSYLKIGNREYCSKTTSYLMADILHMASQSYDKEKRHWKLTQKDVAGVVYATILLTTRKEYFEGFREQHSENYWAKDKDPKQLLNTVLVGFSEALSYMVAEDKQFIFAKWI